MRLKGKVCVVTAAGQGIGAATARAFAREGATVWATDIDAAKLAALDGVTGIQARKLDVLDKAAIAAFAQETGAVDALFNCAGFVHHGTVLDVLPEDWDEVMRINVTANWHLIRAMDTLLKRSDAGRAVFVTSNASHNVRAYRGPYAVSKAALEALGRTYAAETASTPVRVNAAMVSFELLFMIEAPPTATISRPLLLLPRKASRYSF